MKTCENCQRPEVCKYAGNCLTPPATAELIARRSAAACSPSYYARYGPEWEAELIKLPKKFLIGMLRKELIATRNEPDLKTLAKHVCQWVEERTDDVNVEMRDRVEACLRHYLPENAKTEGPPTETSTEENQ